MQIGYENLLNPVARQVSTGQYHFDTEDDTLQLEIRTEHSLRASLVLFSDFTEHHRKSLNSKDDSYLPTMVTPEKTDASIPRSSQSKSTPPSSSTPSKRIKEMDRLIFVNSFDKFAPGELEKLEAIFASCNGSMPTKRYIKGISEQLGMAQCKIKRWFENRLEAIHGLRGGGRPSPSPSRDYFGSDALIPAHFVPILPKHAPDPEINALLEELEGHIEQITSLNEQTSALLLNTLHST